MSSIPSQQPERRYRNLPATPSFSPFAANPLYSSSGSQKECSYITPQFPDSVVAFAKLNGLGCDPQYPQIQPGTCSKPVLEDIPPQIDDPIGTIPLSHTQATSAKYDKRTAFPSKRLLLQSFREKGKLMSWGCTFYGALGVQRGVPFNSEEHDGGAAGGEEVEDGWKLSDYCLTPSQTLVPTVAAMVACGQHSSYIVSAEGTLFSCGRGDMGQLGIGERGLQFPRRGVSKFHKVHLKDDERVSMVVGGYCTAMVLTSENYLYCWGNNSYGQCLKRTSGPVADSPLRFKTGKHYAVDVAQGMTFGALVFDDGALGTWGESTMLGGIVPEEDLEVLGAHGTKCMCKVFQPRFSQRIKCVRAGEAHGMAITEKGTVLTWGCGKGGRLGHGTEDDEVQARRVKALSAHCIVDGSCGSYHTAVVARTGDVFVFGENQKNQLGLFGRQPRRLPETLSLPHPALTVSCGREHTCILLVDGDVMVCGAARCAGLGFGNGLRARAPTRILQSYITLNVASGVSHSIASVVPRITSFSRVGSMSFAGLSKLKNVPIRSAIRSIAGGVNFIILTLETDATISVGRGEQGQLGLGDCMRPARRGDVTAASSFQRVRLPKEVCLQSVSCGPDFVVAIDRRGDIYGWGSNRHGQLCQSVENQQDVFTPVKIRDAYADHQAAQIACGGTFVVALTVEGEVLVHGERAYCGLELPKKDGIHEEGQTRLVTIPTPITSLRGIQAVAAGKTHAMALSSTGTLYTWGSGVLGTGAAATSAYAPVKISLLQNIRKIGCGPATSFAINDAGELLVWGMNSNRQCGVAEDVVLSPVVAHTRVRDAAFAGEVGAVITEGGELRLSGRHHGSTGKVQQLDSFAAEPQPRVLGERSGELGDAASAFTSSRVMAPAETTPTPVEDGLTPPSSARDQGSATRRHDPNAATSPSWALHCAGGWDQILVVAESRRPTAAEVQDAHRGLAALVHEGPQREVVE